MDSEIEFIPRARTRSEYVWDARLIRNALTKYEYISALGIVDINNARSDRRSERS